LKKVAGRRGGIAGFRDVTVTIGARISWRSGSWGDSGPTRKASSAASRFWIELRKNRRLRERHRSKI
jgi:hypothetical protein